MYSNSHSMSNGNSFELDGGLTPGAVPISIVIRATATPLVAKK